MDKRQDLIAKLGEYFVVENDTKLGEWVASVDDAKFEEISPLLASLLVEVETAYRARLVLSEFSKGTMDDDLCQMFSDCAHTRLEALVRLLGFEGDLYE